MITALYYVSCDGCGQFVSEPAASPDEARRLARLDHWGRVGRRQSNHPLGPRRGRDYCPACIATKPEVRAAIRADVDERRAAARGA